MNVTDVHDRIKSLAAERGWSAYELAKRSGIALSSLYNMFERGTMPKIETLEKICEGMGISLSDFFVFRAKPRIGGYISASDEELLGINRDLNARNQERLLVYARGMMEGQSGSRKEAADQEIHRASDEAARK